MLCPVRPDVLIVTLKTTWRNSRDSNADGLLGLAVLAGPWSNHFPTVPWGVLPDSHWLISTVTGLRLDYFSLARHIFNLATGRWSASGQLNPYGNLEASPITRRQWLSLLFSFQKSVSMSRILHRCSLPGFQGPSQSARRSNWSYSSVNLAARLGLEPRMSFDGSFGGFCNSRYATAL